MEKKMTTKSETKEKIDEILTSWFPEYEGVGTVIASAATEIVRTMVQP